MMIEEGRATESEKKKTENTDEDNFEWKNLVVWNGNIDGFIFKKSSPSCGLQEVEIYADPDAGKPVSGGSGVFAEKFRKKLIFIPAAEEDELNSHEGIEKFFQNMTEYKKQRTGK